MALGPFEFVIFFAGILGILVAALVWMLYLSNGSVTGELSLPAAEFFDELEDYFVPSGWRRGHRSEDILLLEKGPDGCLGLLLLVVFFPLGLVYLLTDWGRARMTVRVHQGHGDEHEFLIDWHAAAVRNEVQRFLRSGEQ